MFCFHKCHFLLAGLFDWGHTKTLLKVSGSGNGFTVPGLQKGK